MIIRSLVGPLVRRRSSRRRGAGRVSVRQAVGYVCLTLAVWLAARAVAGLSAGWWSVLASGCVGAGVMWLLLSRRPAKRRPVQRRPKPVQQRVVSADQVPELRPVIDDRAEWERVMSSVLLGDDEDETAQPEYNVTVYPSKGSSKTGPGKTVSRLSDSR